MSFEGENTQYLTYFYLENQGVPSITNPILVLYSGLLYNFETIFVGMEVEIQGINYVVTRFLQAGDPNGKPNAITVFVDYMVSPRVSRDRPDKNVPHNQWKFTDI